MAPRPLSYLFSATKGVLALAPAVVIMAWAVAARVTWWRGDWWWGYHNAAQVIPLLILLTALVVAWDAGSPASGYVAQLDRVPDRPWKVPLSLALVPLVSMVLVLLCAVVAVAVLTISGQGVIDVKFPLVLLSEALMLSLSAAVGLAAGRYLRSPYAAAVAGGIMALLLYWTPGRHHVFEFMGSATAIVNGTPSMSWFMAQVAVLALCVALLASVTFRVLSPKVAAVAGATALVVFVAGSVFGPAQQFDAGAARADRCAQEGAIVVCVYPGYDRLLPLASERLTSFLSRAADLGVNPAAFPTRYEQSGGDRLGRGVGVLETPHDGLRSLKVSSDELAGSLSTPLWCDAMFAEDAPREVLDSRQFVFDWVLWADGAMPQEELVNRHPELAGATPDEAAAAVTAKLDIMRSCDST